MKNINQLITYVLEILLFISIVLTLIELVSENTFFKWTDNIYSYTFFEKALSIFVIYQILTFAILSLYDSSKRDALLSNIKMVKLIIVRLEHGIDFEKLVDEVEESYDDPSLFIYKNDKELIRELKTQIEYLKRGIIDENKFYFYLKNKLVNLEHSYEYYGLEWRLSFILRTRK